jgi:hypothetical protein
VLLKVLELLEQLEVFVTQLVLVELKLELVLKEQLELEEEYLEPVSLLKAI